MDYREADDAILRQFYSQQERKHVTCLYRRRNYLKDLREDKQANSWDHEEIAALNWVLKDLIPEMTSLIRADRV